MSTGAQLGAGRALFRGGTPSPASPPLLPLQIHLDDGRRENGWRNTLAFNPLEHFRLGQQPKAAAPENNNTSASSTVPPLRSPVLHALPFPSVHSPTAAACAGASPTWMPCSIPSWTP